MLRCKVVRRRIRLVLGSRLMMETRRADGPEYKISRDERESVMEIGGRVMIEEAV